MDEEKLAWELARPELESVGFDSWSTFDAEKNRAQEIYLALFKKRMATR